MSFSSGGATALSKASPIAAAQGATRSAPAASDPQASSQVMIDEAPSALQTLTARLNAKLAEISERGFRVKWLEMSQAEMITLFREAGEAGDGGEEVIRLDPDPGVDKAWYGAYEVRASQNACVWIWIEGEVDGEMSVHIID